MSLQNDLFDDKKEFLKDVPKFKEKIIESQQIWNKELLEYLTEKYKNKQAIFIPGNIPSLKNAKEIGIINTKNSVCCNKPLEKKANKVWYCTHCNMPAQRKTITSLRSSDLVQDFKKVHEFTFNTQKHVWENMIKDKLPPYKIGFYFIRESRNSWDYNNVNQILCDLMKDNKDKKSGITTKKWIDDDNMLYLKPYPLGFHYNKSKPGAIITLMDEWLFNYEINH